MYVREFEKDDRETFRALCYEFYQSNATLRDHDENITNLTFERVTDHHENLWGFFIMDKETDKEAGYALVTSYWCNEEGGNIIVLDELFILPMHRKKGYGSEFMEWLEEYYRDKATSITLEVLTTNINACHLYCKEGYVPDGYITYTKKL